MIMIISYISISQTHEKWYMSHMHKDAIQNVLAHALIQKGDRGSGPLSPPPENHKAIGSLAKLVYWSGSPKITRLPSQHLNGVLLAGQ